MPSNFAEEVDSSISLEDDDDSLTTVSLNNVNKTPPPGSDLRSRFRRFKSKEPICTMIDIVKLAAPVGLSLLVANLMNFQTLLFCGHAPSNHSSNVTRVILDAAALATSFSNVTGMAVLIGAATACDTLYAQAFGGKNKKSLGIIVQQSLLILGLVCIGISALWLNAASLLLAVGQDPDVARYAGEYLDILVTSLPGLLGYVVCTRYLQSQSITIPPIIVGLIGNAILAAVDFILVFHFDLGLKGAAWGFVLGMTSQPIGLLIYIRWRKLHLLTWPGWSWKCLDNWLIFSRLAFAGGIMVCLEWWSFEVFLFVAGHLGTLPLAVSAILYQAIYITVMASVGMMIAVNIIIGNSLGSGDWQKARRTFRVGVVMNGILGILMGLMFLATRNELGKIFTDDPNVIEGVAQVIPYLAALEVADYVQAIGSGVIRGAGRQTIGAASNLIAYYVLAIPIGVPLGLKTSLGVRGFWIGMGIGLAFQAIMYLIIVGRINWEQESINAQKRVQDAAGDHKASLETGTDDGDDVPNGGSPVELVAVMSTGDNGEVKCRIAGRGESGSLDGEDLPLDGVVSDTDALIESPGGVQKQTCYTDDLFYATISKEKRRHLLVRKSLVLLGFLSLLLVGIVVRFSVPADFSDDGDDVAWNSVALSNTSSSPAATTVAALIMSTAAS